MDNLLSGIYNPDYPDIRLPDAKLSG